MEESCSRCHSRLHSFWHNSPFSPIRRSNGGGMPTLPRDYHQHPDTKWPASHLQSHRLRHNFWRTWVHHMATATTSITISIPPIR